MSEVEPAQSAQQRHQIYGLNLAILIISGAVVLSLLFYFAYWTEGKSWAAADWTSSGVNSLSESTRNLIKEINSGDKTFKIYSLFAPRSDMERREDMNKDQDDKRRQMLDLLQHYTRLSSKIRVEDFGDRATAEIARQIYDISREKGELKAYEDLEKEFAPLADSLREFAKKEAANIGKAAQAGGTQDDSEGAASLQNNLRNRIPQALDLLETNMKEALQQELPNHEEIREIMQLTLTSGPITGVLTLLSDKDRIDSLKYPKPLTDYLEGAAPEYKKQLDAITAYADKLGKLKVLTLYDVFKKLEGNSVVVIGPSSAEVLTPSDLYSRIPQKETQYFNGEQAISSTMNGMLHPVQIKAVFVGAPSSGDTGYNDIKHDLKEAKIESLTWDPSRQTPEGPQANTEPPPAMGKDVVWIVFPPERSPPMMQGMPPMPGNAQPIIDATRKHMEAGGQVMFMAQANPAGMGPPSEGYPYASLIKDFGIDVRDSYVVVFPVDRRTNTGQIVQQISAHVQLTDFEDHEITRKMQAFGLILGPPEQTDIYTTVVSVHDPVPADAHPQVLLKTPRQAWGESNVSAPPKLDKDDIAGPVPVAAVSILHPGKKDEQRIAVFGNSSLASDFWLEIPDENNEQMFPGNSEIFKNTVLWLAGNENQIAVSAKANMGSRIGAVNHMIAIRWLVAGGVPFLALMLGGIVWVIRHR